ncbi:MAG: FkbM family methyltransferase [Stellaceae bacterium]
MRRWITKKACRRLGLYTERVQTVNNLTDPVDMVRRLDLTCRGVIHVGAHIGQEFEDYRRDGLESVVYVEPIPEVFEKLKERVSVDSRFHPIQALCTDRDGDEVDFHVSSNNGGSSSIFPLGSHAIYYPRVTYVSTLRLRTTTLDSLIFNTPGLDPTPFDYLVMDVQGAEAKVLKGATRTLRQCRFVFAEVSEGGLYDGDVPFEGIMALLKEHGFRLKAIDLNKLDWGNAFFVKTDPNQPIVRR